MLGGCVEGGYGLAFLVFCKAGVAGVFGGLWSGVVDYLAAFWALAFEVFFWHCLGGL